MSIFQEGYDCFCRYWNCSMLNPVKLAELDRCYYASILLPAGISEPVIKGEEMIFLETYSAPVRKRVELINVQITTT